MVDTAVKISSHARSLDDLTPPKWRERDQQLPELKITGSLTV
jgi:hypothetical protein